MHITGSDIKLSEALSESGVVTNKSFEFYDGEWRDNLYPGSPAVVGFVLEDNCCVIYEYLPVTGPEAEPFIQGSLLCGSGGFLSFQRTSGAPHATTIRSHVLPGG